MVAALAYHLSLDPLGMPGLSKLRRCVISECCKPLLFSRVLFDVSIHIDVEPYYSQSAHPLHVGARDG